MSNVRAKFRCMAKVLCAGTSAVQYKFSPVTADEIPENQRFQKYTPSGLLDITIDNPAISFELGQTYYLDFTQAA